MQFPFKFFDKILNKSDSENHQPVKVSQFQNEFMKSSFLPKYEQKIVKISALTTQGRNPDNFSFIFWEKRWLNKFILKLTNLYKFLYCHSDFFSNLSRIKLHGEILGKFYLVQSETFILEMVFNYQWNWTLHFLYNFVNYWTFSGILNDVFRH